jgi:hypothetical protein
MASKIACRDIIGFHNTKDTCWNLVILTIMMHSHLTGPIIQNKILIEGDNYGYTELIKSLLTNHIEKLKYYYPEDYKELFKPEYLFEFFLNIIIRYNNKWNEYKEAQIVNEPILGKLIRSTSNMCEKHLTREFFKFIGYDNITESNGGLIYEEFYLLNLLGIILLDKHIIVETFVNMKEINFDDAYDTIGYLISIPSHGIGLFKCSDGNYKIVDNDNILNFNFDQFIIDLNKIPQSRELYYNKSYGIVLYNTNTKHYLQYTDNPMDNKKLKPILDITKIKIYNGNLETFKNYNMQVSRYMSIEGRIESNIFISSDSPQTINRLIDKLDDITKEKLLGIAYRNNSIMILDLLLDKGAKTYSFIKKYDNIAHFFVIGFTKYTITYKLLITVLTNHMPVGNINNIMYDKKSAFYYALKYCKDPIIIKTLIEQFGGTLYEAMEYELFGKNPALLEDILTKYKIDINSRNEEGETVLELALDNEKITPLVISILMNNGANPNMTHSIYEGLKSSKTILEEYEANEDNKPEIIAILKSLVPSKSARKYMKSIEPSYQKYVGSKAPNLDDIFYKKYIMYANAKSIEPSYLKYVGSETPNLDDIFYKKYIMYKHKYLKLKQENNL